MHIKIKEMGKNPEELAYFTRTKALQGAVMEVFKSISHQP